MDTPAARDHDPRDWIWALLVLTAAVTLVVLVAMAVVAPALTCGCTQPAPGFTPAP